MTPAEKYNVYLNFVNSALGDMVRADALFERYGDEIKFVAGFFRKQANLWGGDKHKKLYRGVRLADPNLDGTILVPHGDYADVKFSSFSESPTIACHFADPGNKGFPVLDLTGRGRKLPLNGYLATANVPATRVLFHYSFFALAPGVWDRVFGVGEWQPLLDQKEATVFVPGLKQKLTNFQTACTDYVNVRYGGTWQAGTPDPFAPPWIGEI